MSEHEFEVRITIYADGRRVGVADALGSSLDQAVFAATTDIACGQISDLTRWGREVLNPESGDPS